MAKGDVLWLDGVVGSQLRDTQGEMLSVDGADISELQAGRGRWNDNHGKGFFNSIGRITNAKKIYKEEDCEDERQKYYWEKVKAPYIYAKGYLYNDEEHVNAKAAAAILRNIHKVDAPLKLKASVEGGVVARGIKDPSLLAQTKIHSVAITFTPANQATLLEPLSLDKTAYDEEADMLLIKSVMHLAETNVPSFRHIERVASAEKITRNIYKIKDMIASLEEEELDKGLKHIAAGAAMMGALAGSPAKASLPMGTTPTEPTVQSPSTTMQVAPPQQKAPSISHTQIVDIAKKKNPNLWAIAQAESSGGKDIKHKTMASGLHKEHTAAGAWALMPKTVAYIMGLSPKLSQKYPEIADKIKDVGANHKAVTEILNSNPAMSYEFAKTLYNHLNQAHKGDKDKIFHSWNHGLTGTKKFAKKFGKDKIAADEYVSKVKQSLKEPRKKVSMNKALTAGYGGASAPTGRTGGTVMMTEQLDDGRRGFKYVTCEHCGDEQIYGKNQVKCRQPDCGKSFSMASLYRVMSGSKKG